ARDHGATRQGAGADLRSSYLVCGADVCPGEEDQLARRPRGLLARPEVQPAVMTRGRWWVLALVIAALALAASANSVHNQFAYDDLFLIVKSARMQTMAGWWREFGHTY